MDYREQAESLLYDAKDWAGDPHIRKDLYSAAQSITDLLARAEAAEARVHELETSHRLEKCENGPECEELGRVRKALAEAEARAEKAERERDEVVKLCGKLMGLCTPPKEWIPKLFRPCINRPGDYMGSGYTFLDSFNRIFDEFTETADKETYRAIREIAEQEILNQTRRMIGQKEE